MDYQLRLGETQAEVEEALKAAFRGQAPMDVLYDAMEYSLLAGGKRIRPILTLEVCRMCGGDTAVAIPLACAVEMVHTYSLIHDDLPCMDDDSLRRGLPTNHKVYGEAMAVLAGDGLLAAAFETILEQTTLSIHQVVESAACLARAAGGQGMVGGQALDMAAQGRTIGPLEVEYLQSLKTGALLSSAAELGCIAAGGSGIDRAAVRRYAQKLGLAFQIRDDMLDVTGDEKILGKSVGSDVENAKTTFVSLKGLENCREQVARLTNEAKEALSGFSDNGLLCYFADTLAGRES